MATGRESSIAIPPAPNWYASSLGDWGGACGTLYAYAARNAVVLVRPDESGARCQRFVGTLVGHTNRVTAVCFARQPGVAHLLLSGSADTNIRQWDTTARRCIRILRGHSSEISALSISPIVHDLCVSGDRNGEVLVWRFGSGTTSSGSSDITKEHQRPTRTLEQIDNTPVLTVALSPSAAHDVAIGHQSGALAVADVGNNSPPKRLPARAGEVQCVAWLPRVYTSSGSSEKGNEALYGRDDGTETNARKTISRKSVGVLAVGSREKSVTLWTWDGERTSLRQTLQLPRCPAHLAENQRGRLWVALDWFVDEDKSKTENGDALKTENENRNLTARDLDAAHVARLVVSSHGGELLCYDVNMDDGLFGVYTNSNSADLTDGEKTTAKPSTSGKVNAPEKFSGDFSHSKTVFGLRVSSRGVAVTTSLDRGIAVWDVTTLTSMWSVTGLGGFAYHAAVDPEDTRRVAVACGDGSVRALVLSEPESSTEISTSESGSASTVLWRGLPQTKATMIAWCPVDGSDGGSVDGEDSTSDGDAATLAVGLEDGRVVTVDPSGGGRHATQRDCHAGAVSGAQWVRVGPPGTRKELITLGQGRLWRWVSLAAPEGRRKRGGGGGGGAFVDITMRFHDAGSIGNDGPPSVITSFAFRDDDSSGSNNSTNPTVAIGWSDGSVSVSERDVNDPKDAFAFRTKWRTTEHSKTVSAVRWHPLAGNTNSNRHMWLASVSEDGGFLVWDGKSEEVVRSAPPSRRSLSDVAWRPVVSGFTEQTQQDTPLDSSDAIAVTTGADGCIRAWDMAGAPTPCATMRGHEGRALFVVWAGASSERRDARRPTATLVTGSDDQTVRAWELDDPSHSPAAEAEGSARAKQDKEAKKLARDKDAGKDTNSSDEKAGNAESDSPRTDKTAQHVSSTNALTGNTTISVNASTGASGGKKKRKGTGGRGIVKPPPWESTPEGIAAGRISAVRLARLLARRSNAGGPFDVSEDDLDVDVDDTSAGYGPHGLGLYLGHEEAMRLLRLEERASWGGDVGGVDMSSSGTENGDTPDTTPRYETGMSSDSGRTGSFRPPERCAVAALFRGEFRGASDGLFQAFDGPIPSDFLAALVGGGREVYAAAANMQADRLESKGEHQRAAVLRLSLHDIRGAIASLRRGGLERDAAALAAARLLPFDPTLIETRKALAAAEETRGGLEAAAKAHLAAGRVGAAVRALARPGVGGARAAAEVALVMGVRGEPEKHVVIRAAKDAHVQGNAADAVNMLQRWSESDETNCGSQSDRSGHAGGEGRGGGDVDEDIAEVLQNIEKAQEGEGGTVGGQHGRV